MRTADSCSAAHAATAERARRGAYYPHPALDEARRAHAQRITFLHVQDKGRIDPHLTHRLEEFNEIDRSRLDMLKQLLQRKSNVTVDIELCYGSPFEETTRLVRDRNVHLVVMGSQGRGFPMETLLESVSHNVARHAEAPVLLIPADRRGAARNAGGTNAPS